MKAPGSLRLSPDPLLLQGDRERRLAEVMAEIRGVTTVEARRLSPLLGELTRLLGHLELGDLSVYKPVRLSRDEEDRLVVEQLGVRYVLDADRDVVYRLEAERVETYQRGRVVQVTSLT